MGCFLVLLLSIAAYAQRPTFGVKVGIPVSAVCEAESLGSAGSANSCADRYVVGPALMIYVIGGFSVDLAALYSRVQLQGAARSTLGPSFSIQRSGSAWEFPMVAKYRIGKNNAAPFVGAGPTLRRVSMHGENVTIPGNPSPGQPVTSATTVEENRLDAGVVLAGGVEFKTRIFRLSPEIRYSRWRSHDPCAQCGPYTLPLARSNSIVLLLGIGF